MSDVEISRPTPTHWTLTQTLSALLYTMASLAQRLSALLYDGANVNVSHPTSHPPTSSQQSEDVPEDVGQFALKRYHDTVFAQELVREKIALICTSGHFSTGSSRRNEGQIEEGTYAGTQLALTEMYDRIERAYASWLNTIGIEPIIPQVVHLKERVLRYQWTTKGGFPPHLASIPGKKQVSEWTIFNKMGLADTATLIPKLVPNKRFLGSFSAWLYEEGNSRIHGFEYHGLTIADMEEGNRNNKQSGTDVMRGDNIGLLSDWWSDARFAQQSFTGANPTTINAASAGWIRAFEDAAAKQGLSAASHRIARAGPNTLFVQDCSYFREAMGVQEDNILISKDPSTDAKYECASVSLFELHENGKLHPIAIIIDWRGTMERSMVIFNKRLQPHEPLYTQPTEIEKSDWPWRYAKTCAQSSDWIRQELAIRLVHTHLVEEVIIVAANRCFESDHPVFRLLEPHWLKTLSLNAAARNTLVPDVIIDLLGIAKSQAMSFISHAFSTFDFCGKYVPNDLPSRGFPLADLDKTKFGNYAYARNMTLMWAAIRQFVASMLDIDYAREGVDPTEKGTRKYVAEDNSILAWCHEIRNEGHLSSFPTIHTRDHLIDAVTMCIYIASPQHTAVVNSQNFYQAFVINKPPALYTPPPTNLNTLLAYTERDLVKALPIGRQRDWLLAAHIPDLLGSRVAEGNDLVTYAVSLWSVYRKKTGKDERRIAQCAREFYGELMRLRGVFERHGGEMEGRSVSYMALGSGEIAGGTLG